MKRFLIALTALMFATPTFANDFYRPLSQVDLGKHYQSYDMRYAGDVWTTKCRRIGDKMACYGNMASNKIPKYNNMANQSLYNIQLPMTAVRVELRKPNVFVKVWGSSVRCIRIADKLVCQ